MNKKTIYWTCGIAAILIILLVIWGVLGRKKENQTGVPSAESGTAENLSSYLKEQDTLMNKMMEDMEGVVPTGNAALDFLEGMIPHHQAAVTMCESYLKYGGTDGELRTLAENIIQVQEQEIQQMQAFADEIKSGGAQNLEQEQAYLKGYERMLSSHHSSHASHGTPANVEAAFAEGMIMHHQMAVEMAEAIVGNTDNEQVTLLAQSIIEAQQTEISQMQNIYKRISKKKNEK